MPELGIGLGIQKGAAPKTKLLLDKYDIDAAFSLRKVRAEYSGPCVRVRNSAGNFADIGFLSNGTIDIDALNAHCGGSDGTVQTWYNQSTEGGRFNAVQDTAADQPIIYDASEGGYLGYLENTGDRYLELENNVAATSDIYVVYEPSSTNTYGTVVGESNSNPKGIIIGSGTTVGVTNSRYNSTSTYTGDTADTKFLACSYTATAGTNPFITVNGYVAGQSTVATNQTNSIGAIFTKINNGTPDTGVSDFDGKVWEVFLSTSDLSSKRIALENSILSANGLTVPEKTLLEKYNAGAVAYSLRCVNREYVGPVVEVLGDQTTVVTEDVYLDSTGVVNKSRITELCTDDEASNALVYGYITKWYDQGGGGVTATNTGANNTRPIIHDSTDGVVLSNGEPAMLFNDADTVLTTGFIPNNSGTSFAVFSPKEYVNTHTTYMFAKSTGSDWYITAQDGDTNNNVMSTGWADGVTSVRVSGYGSITEEPGGRNFLWDNTNGKQSLVFVDSWGSGSKSWGISNYSNTGNSFNIEGYVQEWIWWEDSIKDSIDSIESSVNNHYLIYQEATSSPSSGFLSDYDGAAAAYSVRQLGDANLCMKVRRSGDDATKNIGFGSDGFVDTTAISDFCGTDDGFVVTWYDQSGNAVDATQATAASQPKIYDGTDGVVKENGYPATEWSGGAQALETTYTTNSSEFTVVAVAKSDANATNKTVVLVPEALIFYQAIEDARHIQGNGAQTSYTPADSTDQMLHFVGNSGSESFAGDNGDTFTTLAESTATNGEFKIGNNANGSIGFDGKMQEVVYYTSDQSSNRTPIEENINDAFNVYPDADTTPESGFLSEFSGAAAAYSVRKLGDSPVCMRVRKTVSAVDYYQIIGFDANGDLDTAAIEEFGGSADVHVQTWYDQSGNGRHQVQDTNAEQPKIYDGTNGFYYTEGNVALWFNDQGMEDSSDNQITVLDQSVFVVGERTSSLDDDRSVFVGHTETATYQVFTAQVWGNTGVGGTVDQMIMFSGLAESDKVSVPLDTKQNLSTYGWHHDEDSIFQYNGEELTPTDNDTLSPTQSTYTISVGSNGYNSIEAYLTEVIVYEGMRDATTRTNIEKNQNEHFLVHQSASTSPATGLLSKAPNAHTAISTRQLGDAVLCMKVNRDSDDVTRNIGFKNGKLDTQAIIDFANGGNVSVDTWYDQSGNDRHYTDPTGRTFTKAGVDSTMPASGINRFRIYDQQLGIMTIGNNFPAVSRGSGVTLLMANDCGDDKATMVFTITEINAVNDTFFIQTDAFRYVSTQSTESNIQGAGVKVYVDGRNNSNAVDTYEKNKISQVSVDVTSTGDSTYSSEPLLGGRYNTSGLNSPDVDFCEFITYDTGDFDTIRAIVDTNQNNFYKAYKKFSTGLLDSYPGAVGAYSLRRLSSSYDGPLIEVEQSDSGTTHDIYARGNGDLNTGEMYNLEPANTQNTLRISKWYDQSGNGNDLVQATDAQQPTIKQASSDGSTHDGLIVTDGDKPAIEFDGDVMGVASTDTFDALSVFVVANKPEEEANSAFISRLGDTSGAGAKKGDFHIRSNSAFIRTIAGNTDGSGYDYPEINTSNIISFIWDGSVQSAINTPLNEGEAAAYMNSKLVDQTAVNGNFNAGSDELRINYASSVAPDVGKYQEVLVYNSDESSNRVAIEKNLNTYYVVYDQPLLDVVEDAAAAYSLRKLRAGYTGPAINVYNGTDYKDIYFKADGTLDTGAISRFCGSNDGTVAIWYDQSGNSNHAEQATDGDRPKIYDGTNGIVTEGERPALDWSDDRMTMPATIGVDYSIAWAWRTDVSNTNQWTLYTTLNSGTDAYWNPSSEYRLYFGQTVYSFNVSEGAVVPTTHSVVWQNYSTTETWYMRSNGNEKSFAADGDTYTPANGELGRQLDGRLHEVIIWNANKSADRHIVDANINRYYSIY